MSIVVVLGIGLGSSAATGEPDEPSASAELVPAASLVHAPFTPYTADGGALAFDDLHARERAAIVAERERESSSALAQRFEMMKAMTIERGERTHAEVAASMIGLEGFGAEGVVP